MASKSVSLLSLCLVFFLSCKDGDFKGKGGSKGADASDPADQNETGTPQFEGFDSKNQCITENITAMAQCSFRTDSQTSNCWEPAQMCTNFYGPDEKALCNDATSNAAAYRLIWKGPLVCGKNGAPKLPTKTIPVDLIRKLDEACPPKRKVYVQDCKLIGTYAPNIGKVVSTIENVWGPAPEVCINHCNSNGCYWTPKDSDSTVSILCTAEELPSCKADWKSANDPEAKHCTLE